MFAFESQEKQLVSVKGTVQPEVLETISQKFGRCKFGSEESLTEMLDLDRFTRVVDNEMEKWAGSCVGVQVSD